MSRSLTQWLCPLCLSLDSPTISSHTAAVRSKEQEASTCPNSGWAHVTLHTDPLCVCKDESNNKTFILQTISQLNKQKKIKKTFQKKGEELATARSCSQLQFKANTFFFFFKHTFKSWHVRNKTDLPSSWQCSATPHFQSCPKPEGCGTLTIVH